MINSVQYVRNEMHAIEMHYVEMYTAWYHKQCAVYSISMHHVEMHTAYCMVC